MGLPATENTIANMNTLLSVFSSPTYTVKFIQHDDWNCYWKITEGIFSCILTADPTATNMAVIKSILDTQVAQDL